MTKSTVPASSSKVWKVTPLAVPGRCTIMLMPATRTRLPGGLATGVAVRVNGDRVGPDARRERAVGRVHERRWEVDGHIRAITDDGKTVFFVQNVYKPAR